MKKIKVTIGGQMNRKDIRDLKIEIKSMELELKENIIMQERFHLMFLLAVVAGVTTIKAKLGFSKRYKDAGFLVNAKAIYAALLANTGGFFTVPFANLALMETQITNLDKAITNVKTRALGGVGAKNAAKLALYGTLEASLDYVNSIVRSNQTFGEEIITSAKMVLNGTKSNKKQDFEVRQGAGTGVVILSSLAVMFKDAYVKASYDWQYSIDGGKTWVDLNSTTESKATVYEMPLGNVMFRKRTNSKKVVLLIGVWLLLLMCSREGKLGIRN